jgi:hypothetical protein
MFDRNMKYKTLVLICAVMTSCAPQYAREIKYSLSESYPQAKSKLDAYQNSQPRKFNLFQDEIKVYILETDSNRRCVFTKRRWAPDIGAKTEYEGVLTAKMNGSDFVVTEGRSPRVVYDGPRLITGDKLGNLKKLDSWIVTNLKIKSRVVGEAQDSPPLYH